jgi:hypothetical protein
MTYTPTTHAKIAKALGVSRQYITKLTGLGMPVNNARSARAWIKRRSKEIGTDPDSKMTLTGWREEKLRLECQILTLRLEREADVSERVPVDEIGKFIRYFTAYMAVATTSMAESLTNEIAGKSEIETYGALRQICNKALFLAALGYIQGGGPNNPDVRLVEYAEKCVEEQFASFPSDAKRDLEQNLLALIKWAKEQP